MTLRTLFMILLCCFTAQIANAASLNKNSGKKIGLILGPNAPDKVINKASNIGSWYYTYGPYPNRQGKNNTLNMSKASSKEFVPMIYGRAFFKDDTYSNNNKCALAYKFVTKDSPLCTSKEIKTSLQAMLTGFKNHKNPPKYLMLANEPWIPVAGKINIWQGKNILLTPWQEAFKMSLISPATSQLNLDLVSPTADIWNPEWLSHFLKRCVEIKKCNINDIKVFSVHKYTCDRKSWVNEFTHKQFQARLFKKLKDYKNGRMTPAKWQRYINSRKIWVTEASCNKDLDFIAEQKKSSPSYPIRTQSKSCMRASGKHTKNTYGSLPTILSMSDTQIERIAWWTTYAPTKGYKDHYSASSKNVADRVRAARLFYEKGNYLTPMGKLIEQAYNDATKINNVKCTH